MNKEQKLSKNMLLWNLTDIILICLFVLWLIMLVGYKYDCDITTEGWLYDVDFLVPNIVWIFASISIMIYSFVLYFLKLLKCD